MGDWEDRLFALFDDLEQQAEAAFAAERDFEVADRAQAEYAQVGLATRLMASLGQDVVLRLSGVGPVAGTLERVADGWCLIAGDSGQWVVRLAAVQLASGVSPRSVPEAAWPVASRLGLRSALRGISGDGVECRLLTLDGAGYDVRLGRVGADFVEGIVGDGREPTLFPFGAIAAVTQRRDGANHQSHQTL